ncbi:lipase member H-B isoform X2 [Cimex lectularius]|uniref:Lipase domain-containing protein n=1 Tax=Cimex lectularius TaxID=79782 RepID=A0A8I6SD47_CIMLE|nr:lipase member H-B isoform X2 [Cimex lectularius]XP_024081437.1 lipase member H-B isoform X2 [Cimex lectularius]XP_024081438.1 lipase member H-B isoform X2 [Cimex lectularius]XP_024081439.1 lipase member H-B isoform X2 [Cimex lectularius]
MSNKTECLYPLRAFGILFNAFDIRYWRCVMKRSAHCPDRDIKFYFYSSVTHRRKLIDVRSNVPLKYSGWDPDKKNVFIIHGFNGTERKVPMTYIRDAYLRRGDYNVFTVDWEPIARFPCYLSSISNTRLVAQCSAQFYSYLTHNGASAEKTVCVGHSLGAHICGMVSNHLDIKMHKIIGLDPARPLVDRFGGKSFKLTKDDAHVVQVIHTNAGLLGEHPQIGHVDFCVNGGRSQPACKNQRTRIRKSKIFSKLGSCFYLFIFFPGQARCSHFMSACYFSATIADEGVRFKGVPCTASCKRIKGLEEFAVSMGEHTPETARGTYCLSVSHIKSCPFD